MIIINLVELLSQVPSTQPSSIRKLSGLIYNKYENRSKVHR